MEMPEILMFPLQEQVRSLAYQTRLTTKTWNQEEHLLIYMGLMVTSLSLGKTITTTQKNCLEQMCTIVCFVMH